MIKEFTTYRIYYQSHPQRSEQSRLTLLNGGAYVGHIVFLKDGVNLPANYETYGNPVLHFPASKFDEIMNVLRHEEPLYIALDPSNGMGTICTSNEPIGEEERD
jgi:hypothetical protein